MDDDDDDGETIHFAVLLGSGKSGSTREILKKVVDPKRRPPARHTIISSRTKTLGNVDDVLLLGKNKLQDNFGGREDK